jgi:hypothetical protein
LNFATLDDGPPNAILGIMPKRKRTRTESQDANQFAASIVRQTIASTPGPVPVDLDDSATVSQIMREMGRRGGIKGAATLNARLTPKQRSLSARKAAKARWANSTKKTA